MVRQTTVILLGTMLGTAAVAQSTTPQGAPVETARAALEQWVETRSVIDRETRDWTTGKALLQDRIGVVQREVTAMRQRIAEAKQNTVEADRKKAELVAENERLVAAAGGLAADIAGLETRARKLLARLPDPLREKLKAIAARLPGEGQTTKATLGERFLTVVGVLNEVDKFQREITVASEVRTLGDGTRAEVTAVYVGIAFGCYVTQNGKAAGVGLAGADAFTWTPADAEAPAIQKIVAILKNEQPAAFVPVSVKVQ